MKPENIDTLIFVKPHGEQDRRTDVINIIKTIPGIAAARQHPWIKKLVELSYNPQEVNCSDIIRTINQSGCHSAQIGM